MFTTMSVQVHPDTLLRLIGQLQRAGGEQDISVAINTALSYWLDAQQELFMQGNPPSSLSSPVSSVRGYQWKSLFLPDGTVLRSWSYGEHNYACVEGDRIMHRGRSVSPNQFARTFARTTRNAWFDLSVRRPGDRHFKMADLLRKELNDQASLPPQTIASTQPVTTLATVLATAPATATATATGPNIATTITPNSAPPSARTIDQEPGWDLPERRKFRCRLEDVAY